MFEKPTKRWAVEHYLNLNSIEQGISTPSESSKENCLSGWHFIEIDVCDIPGPRELIIITEDQKDYIKDFWSLIHFHLHIKGILPTNLEDLRESAFFAQGEQEHWCENNCTGKWFRLCNRDTYIYGFEFGSDAIAFRLVFDDQIKRKGNTHV